MSKLVSLAAAATAATAAAAAALYMLYYRTSVKRRIPKALLDSPYGSECIAAVEIILKAGKRVAVAMQQGVSGSKGIQTKGSDGVDFVTMIDRENEKEIFDYLRKAFSTYNFIGEEGTSQQGTGSSKSNKTWICDPVDGTTNFVHNFPKVCISIGLYEETATTKQSVLGVVYDPIADELFLAARGCGAYLNGKRITTSSATKISEALILTEFGYQREVENLDAIWAVVRALLLKNTHSIRILGSGVLDLCFVACGRLDAVYSGIAKEGWKPWDHCAAAVIVQEAGGSLCSLTGEPFDVFGDNVLACSSSSLSVEMVTTIDEAIKGHELMVLARGKAEAVFAD